MSEHYPKFRLHAPDGRPALRVGLVLAFFMKHSHGEIASAVARVLERYCEAVGREKLVLSQGVEGEWQRLNEAGWKQVHQELLGDPEAPNTWLHLVDRAEAVVNYAVLYHGYQLDAPLNQDKPDLASGLSLWLPTEELETHGPGWVRQLAVDMARELPLSSGYASLVFQHLGAPLLEQPFLELSRRHPGIDFLEILSTTWAVGTRIRGAYWLNFYGPPLLEQLGGAAGLRAKLTSPGVEVEELGPVQKVLVSLGEWPEAGDEEQGKDMSAYQELARVLEPHLDDAAFRWPDFWPPGHSRWMRRFLD
jgi:hypothetical protein